MLNLLARLFGPIFAKEFIELSRRRRTFIERTLYAVLLLVAVMVAWESTYASAAHDQLPTHLMAEIARGLFIGLSIVQFGAVGILTPTLVSGLIAGEREAHTLDSLLSSPLSNREIVLGKFASRLTVVILLVFSSLPVHAILMLFGGVDLISILRVQAATLLALFFSGGISLLFSTVIASPMGALILSYTSLAIYLVVVPFLAALVMDTARSTTLEDLIGCTMVMTNPIATFCAAAFSSAHQEFSRHCGEWFFPCSFAAPMLISAVCIGLSLVWLRRQPPARKSRTVIRTRAVDVQQPWITNPLALRAMRAFPYDSSRYVPRVTLGFAILGVVALVMALNVRSGQVAFELVYIIHAAAWIVTLVIVALVAGSSAVGDRRRGFLDQILITPLDPREIVDGMYSAVWMHLRAVVALLGISVCVLLLTEIISPLGALFLVLLGVVFFMLVVAFGVACSLAAERAPQALVPTLGWLFLMLAGPDLLAITFGIYGQWIVWLSTLCLLPVGYWFVRNRLDATVTGSYQFLVHIALTSLATAWLRAVWPIRDNEIPLLMISPQWWFMAIIGCWPGRHFPPGWNVFSTRYEQNWGLVPDTLMPLSLLTILYLAALTAHYFYIRSWTIRNFERLVRRDVA